MFKNLKHLTSDFGSTGHQFKTRVKSLLGISCRFVFKRKKDWRISGSQAIIIGNHTAALKWNFSYYKTLDTKQLLYKRVTR